MTYLWTTNTSSLVQGTRRPLFTRSSTKTMERKQGHLFFPTHQICFQIFSSGARNRKTRVTLMAHSFFLLHLPRRRTFYMHISVVPVYMTPYQLGINWSSWMFNERKGTIWMLLSLLVSAAECTWISYRDQTMTEPKALHCFDWDQLFWRTLH